jgi:hypothetical protein
MKSPAAGNDPSYPVLLEQLALELDSLDRLREATTSSSPNIKI